jgi:hypothetical protein
LRIYSAALRLINDGAPALIFIEASPKHTAETKPKAVA